MGGFGQWFPNGGTDWHSASHPQTLAGLLSPPNNGLSETELVSFSLAPHHPGLWGSLVSMHPCPSKVEHGGERWAGLSAPAPPPLGQWPENEFSCLRSSSEVIHSALCFSLSLELVCPARSEYMGLMVLAGLGGS